MGLDESELKQVLVLEQDPEDPWHISASGLTVRRCTVSPGKGTGKINFRIPAMILTFKKQSYNTGLYLVCCVR